MRLTILGGFLGSGKTTWLRHQIRTGLPGDVMVIVNEAADVPVDHLLLAGPARFAVLAGGCACCDARDALIVLLRRVADARVGARASEPRLEHIVLETSGLADPGAIVEAVRADPVLAHHVVVSEIIVAVDAIIGLDQIRCEPLGRRQAEIADRLVVTKVDACAAEALLEVLATLRELNPGAAISGAVRGSEQPLPDFATVTAAPLPPLAGAGAPMLAARLSLDGVDWTALCVWLSALLHARGDDIVRVKGVVRTPAGRLLLQSVRHSVQSPQILPEGDKIDIGEPEVIVVIGRGFKADDLSRSLRYFVQG